jgi:hypothetical protein
MNDIYLIDMLNYVTLFRIMSEVFIIDWVVLLVE